MLPILPLRLSEPLIDYPLSMITSEEVLIEYKEAPTMRISPYGYTIGGVVGRVGTCIHEHCRGGRKGLRYWGIGLFLVRCCGNFYFKVRYCGFQSPSGVW